MAWHQLVSEKWIDGTWKQKPFLILKIAYAKKKRRNFNCDAKPKCLISLWNCSNKSSGLATSYFDTNPGLLFLYQLPSRSPFSEPQRGYHNSAKLQMIQNLTAFVGFLILCLSMAPALFYHCFTVKAEEIAICVWEWQPECRCHWWYFFRDWLHKWQIKIKQIVPKATVFTRDLDLFKHNTPA